MLSLNDFSLLTLEDKQRFDQYYVRFPPFHSGMLFSSMISWNNYVGHSYAFVDGVLLLMANVKDELQFRAPIGKTDTAIIADVCNLALREGGSKPFGFINTATKQWMTQQYPSLQFTEERHLFDYVYRSADLATLPGSGYAKIRNRLNKFQKSTPYTVEMIGEDNMDEIREFLKRWCLWRDCESDELLENERQAILFSMSHFFDLGLSGLALRINDSVEAIAVFEKMNNDTIVVHYEKGSPEYDGIYKAINMESARYLQNEFMFIDREEDMGIPGLRQAKLSYRPHHLIEVFSLEKKQLSLCLK